MSYIVGQSSLSSDPNTLYPRIPQKLCNAPLDALMSTSVAFSTCIYNGP